MSHDAWTHPGLDEGGFISLDDLRRESRNQSEDSFLREYPQPGLLAVYQGRTESGLKELFSGSDDGVQLLTMTTKGHSFLRYLGKVAFVTKRPGNPFGHLVSIGRSPQNDITVAVESVSKVHGYFMVEGSSWCYTDHGSTNGSMLGDQILQKAVFG